MTMRTKQRWAALAAIGGLLVVLAQSGVLTAAAEEAGGGPANRAASAIALDLGTLGGDTSWANDINDDGTIVGSSYVGVTERHAFLWSPDTFAMTDLGTLETGTLSSAQAINESGQVVGWSSTDGAAGQRAFLWDPEAEEMTDLGTLGGSESEALDINEEGQVVGWSALPGDTATRPFLWDPDTEEMTDLGTLGGGSGTATAINDAGIVVGSSMQSGDLWSGAFRWDPATEEMTDLGTLGGDAAGANDIATDGTIVGQSQAAGNTNHAFVWDPATEEMSDLGTLGGAAAYANGITDPGYVVGTSSLGSTSHGFVWDPVNDELADLGTLGGSSSNAEAISSLGEVVGAATLEDGSRHAVLWQWPFRDVDLQHLFVADITWLVAEGITTGYEDGTFRPAATITRQTLAAFLYRFAGAPDGPDPGCTTAAFPDVPTTHPFCGEIDWAADEGITGGFPDGTFRPTVVVTRQTTAAMLYRLAGSPRGDNPVCTSAAFSDVPTTHQFCGEIDWAADEGVTGGFADGTFRPTNPVSRQAMAAFLHRIAPLV